MSGNGITPVTSMDIINRKKTDYNVLWNDYLNGVLDPHLKNQAIPDESLFPFTTVQVVTVGEVTCSDKGTFLMFATPDPTDTGYFYNGATGVTSSATIVVNGTTYGPAETSALYPNTLYDDFQDTITAWRLVSMGSYITYIGPPLTASGRLATACIPSEKFATASSSFQDYTELANYNYSYTGAAIDGATQIWFPAGSRTRQYIDINDDAPFGSYPAICIAADGLPASTKTFQVKIIQNYEIFTTSQLLTGHRSRKASNMQIDHATSTLSKVYKNTGGGHVGSEPRDHTPWWKTALSVGKDVVETALPILSMFV
jgi:hypothetical protein